MWFYRTWCYSTGALKFLFIYVLKLMNAKLLFSFPSDWHVIRKQICSSKFLCGSDNWNFVVFKIFPLQRSNMFEMFDHNFLYKLKNYRNMWQQNLSNCLSSWVVKQAYPGSLVYSRSWNKSVLRKLLEFGIYL